MSVTIESLQSQLAAMAKALPLFTGRLNKSTPRADGKEGSAFYGSIDLSVLHPAISAAQAEGRAQVKANFAVYPRINSHTGETFYSVKFTGIYEPEAEAGAESEAG